MHFGWARWLFRRCLAFYRSSEWSEMREAAKSIQPSIILPDEFYPRMVSFHNINDGSSLSEINHNDLESSLGKNYKIHRILLSVTNEIISEAIKNNITAPPYLMKKVYHGSKNADYNLFDGKELMIRISPDQFFQGPYQ